MAYPNPTFISYSPDLSKKGKPLVAQYQNMAACALDDSRRKDLYDRRVMKMDARELSYIVDHGILMAEPYVDPENAASEEDPLVDLTDVSMLPSPPGIHTYSVHRTIKNGETWKDVYNRTWVFEDDCHKCLTPWAGLHKSTRRMICWERAKRIWSYLKATGKVHDIDRSLHRREKDAKQKAILEGGRKAHIERVAMLKAMAKKRTLMKEESDSVNKKTKIPRDESATKEVENDNTRDKAHDNEACC